MNPCEKHTASQARSSALSVVYVGRVTPDRYSARTAIHRYRHIQGLEDFHAGQVLLSRFQTRG